MSLAAKTELCYNEKDIRFHTVIPVQDECNYDLLKKFDFIGDWISKARLYGNVLVHCIAGISRSSSGLIAYMIKYLGFSFEDALRHCQSRRSIINPNEGFVEQLKIYEASIKDNPFADDQSSDPQTSNSQLEPPPLYKSSSSLASGFDGSQQSSQGSQYVYITPKKEASLIEIPQNPSSSSKSKQILDFSTSNAKQSSRLSQFRLNHANTLNMCSPLFGKGKSPMGDLIRSQQHLNNNNNNTQDPSAAQQSQWQGSSYLSS